MPAPRITVRGFLRVRIGLIKHYMKSNIILAAVIFCVALIGLLVWGYGNNKDTTAEIQKTQFTGNKSSLVAPSVFYDFGTISMKNGNVSHDFLISNPTDKDIIINTIETSCMCTSAFFVKPSGSVDGPFGMPGMGGANAANDTIKSGETGTLRVVYDPNAHGPAGVGTIDRFITLTQSAGATLQYEIKAVVTP